jgi:hypothetical protein
MHGERPPLAIEGLRWNGYMPEHMHTSKIASTPAKAIENYCGYPQKKGCKDCTAEQHPSCNGFWFHCPTKF